MDKLLVVSYYKRNDVEVEVIHNYAHPSVQKLINGCRPSMVIGHNGYKFNSFSFIRKLWRFIGYDDNNIDTAYPIQWVDANQELIAQHETTNFRGCQGWTYEHNNWGQPVWSDEVERDLLCELDNMFPYKVRVFNMDTCESTIVGGDDGLQQEDSEGSSK